MSAPWYAQDILAIVRALKTDLRTGLTTLEAASRAHDSTNADVAMAQPKPLWSVIVEQATNAQTALLAAAGVGSVLGGLATGTPAYWQGIVCLVVGIAMVAIRVWLRIRIDRDLSLIRAGVRRKARVLRNGEPVDVDPLDIVLGDVLRLRAGDAVPADARVFACQGLCVNQSPLTGISDPSEKTSSTLTGELSPQEQTNMLFAGSFVHSGTGSAVVVAVGDERTICQFYANRHAEFPLVATHDHVARAYPKIAWLGAVGALILAALVHRGVSANAGETLHAASVAVAFVLAVLPAQSELLTLLVFAKSLKGLVRLGASVQDPEMLESLALTTTVCFDPQGVITRDEMAVHRVFVDGQVFDGSAVPRLLGAGTEIEPNEELLRYSMPDVEYSDAPEDTSDGPTAPPDLYLLLVSTAMCALHADAGEDGREAMEPRVKDALLQLARNAGIDASSFRGLMPKVADLPYDSTRRRQSVLFRTEADRGYLFVIGSVAPILEQSKTIRLNDEEDVLQARQRETLFYVHDVMRSDTTHVVGVAYRRIFGDIDHAAENIERLEDGVTFLGMIGFSDPLRGDLPEVFDACSRAGMRLVMMADAEPQVARRIARECGLLDHRSQLLTGDQLNLMEDDDLMPMVDRVIVYSQLRGDQKARVTSILRRRENDVAFMGRNMYDIPALRHADVSIAPARFSADAAVHEAGIVLEDATLGGLYRVLRLAKDAGRVIRRVSHWSLSVHAALGFLLAIGAVVGLFLGGPKVPLELSQLVWAELLIFGVPFSLAAVGMRFPEPTHWATANRNVPKGIAWQHVASRGLVLALMSLAAGIVVSRSVPAGPSRAAAYQAASAFVLVSSSLVLLLRDLIGRRGPGAEFAKANRWLIAGSAVSAFLAAVVPFTPIGGLFGAPGSETLAPATFRVMWVVLAALPVAAWFMPQPE